MTLQLFGSPADVSRPAGPAVRAVLDRSAAFPGLAEKYGALAAAGDPPDIRRLPPLSAEELRAAVWQGIRAGLTRDGSAVLYLGGGTTVRPSATLVPADLFAADILRAWAPLDGADVLLNLSRGTRLWPVHDLCNVLAAHSGASSIPYGSPAGGDFAQWVDFFAHCGVTALAADTPTLEGLLRFCRLTGRSLDWLRTLIWVGTGLDGATADLIDEVLPQARVWGLYGSVESWAVAGNGPGCARDVFHPLPHQHVEVLDGEILVSTLHDRAIVPLLRYRTGDLGEFTTCPCGDERPALRLLGRVEDVLSFRGARFSRTELAELARAVEEVEEVEVLVLDRGRPTERLQLLVRLGEGAIADQYLSQWIRECVVSSHLTLSQVVSSAPDCVEVVAEAAARRSLAA